MIIDALGHVLNIEQWRLHESNESPHILGLQQREQAVQLYQTYRQSSMAAGLFEGGWFDLVTGQRLLSPEAIILQSASRKRSVREFADEMACALPVLDETAGSDPAQGGG